MSIGRIETIHARFSPDQSDDTDPVAVGGLDVSTIHFHAR